MKTLMIKKHVPESIDKSIVQKSIADFKAQFPNDQKLQNTSNEEIEKQVLNFMADDRIIQTPPVATVTDVDYYEAVFLGIPSCEESMAVVIVDVIFMLLGFVGIHVSAQEAADKAVLRLLGSEVVEQNFLKLFNSLNAAKDISAKAKTIFSIASEAYKAGMVKAVLAEIRSSMTLRDWIVTGVAAVAQVATLFLTDGAAFIAEVVLNTAAVAYVVSDSIKATQACSNQRGSSGSISPSPSGFRSVPPNELTPLIVERFKKYTGIGKGDDPGDPMPPLPFIPKCVEKEGFALVDVKKPDGSFISDLWSRESFMLNLAQSPTNGHQMVDENLPSGIAFIIGTPIALEPNTQLCNISGSSQDRRVSAWIRVVRDALAPLGICTCNCRITGSNPPLIPHGPYQNVFGGHVGLYDERRRLGKFERWFLIALCPGHNATKYDYPNWMIAQPGQDDEIVVEIEPYFDQKSLPQSVANVFQFDRDLVFGNEHIHFNETYSKADYQGQTFDVIISNPMVFFLRLKSPSDETETTYLFFKDSKENKIYRLEFLLSRYSSDVFPDSSNNSDNPCQWAGKYIWENSAFFTIDSAWNVEYKFNESEVSPVPTPFVPSGKLLAANPYVGVMKSGDYPCCFFIQDIVRDRIVTWYANDSSLGGLGFRLWQRG